MNRALLRTKAPNRQRREPCGEQHPSGLPRQGTGQSDDRGHSQPLDEGSHPQDQDRPAAIGVAGSAIPAGRGVFTEIGRHWVSFLGRTRERTLPIRLRNGDRLFCTIPPPLHGCKGTRSLTPRRWSLCSQHSRQMCPVRCASYGCPPVPSVRFSTRVSNHRITPIREERRRSGTDGIPVGHR
jgi:hypothetical protein